MLQLTVELGGVRLAELMGTFSLATDAGTGVPDEHMLRSAALAVRLGELADRRAALTQAVKAVGQLLD